MKSKRKAGVAAAILFILVTSLGSLLAGLLNAKPAGFWDSLVGGFLMVLPVVVFFALLAIGTLVEGRKGAGWVLMVVAIICVAPSFDFIPLELAAIVVGGLGAAMAFIPGEDNRLSSLENSLPEMRNELFDEIAFPEAYGSDGDKDNGGS